MSTVGVWIESGEKGVKAANLGVITALFPAFGFSLWPLGLILLFGTGYASVASATIAVLIPIGLAIRAAVVDTASWVHPIYGVLTAISVCIALLPNFKRLKAGTERMVGPRAKARQRREESDNSS